MNLDALDRVVATAKNSSHTLTRKKLLGEHEKNDWMVSDLLLQPGGIVGAFFYTLNIVCMEWHSPMNFCPISININNDTFDKMEAKSFIPKESNNLYGIDHFDEAQIDALTYATIDRLFKPVYDPETKDIVGAKYIDCQVYCGGGNSILPASPENVIAASISRLMGKPSSQFIAVTELAKRIEHA